MKYIAGVGLKCLQLLTTIAAVIVKKIADLHSERVVTRNQKFSTEWNLLNKLISTDEGNDFSILTFLGYLFITAVLLISRVANKKLPNNCSEKIFLFFGIVFFALEGYLLFSSVEYLPPELAHYSFLLGSISFFGALLFLVDFMIFSKIIKTTSKTSQTEFQILEEKLVAERVTIESRKQAKPNYQKKCYKNVICTDL